MKDIDYKYLNLDDKVFYDTESELMASVKYYDKAYHKAIPNIQHNQVLITAGGKEVTDIEAIVICRRLTGIL